MSNRRLLLHVFSLLTCVHFFWFPATLQDRKAVEKKKEQDKAKEKQQEELSKQRQIEKVTSQQRACTPSPRVRYQDCWCISSRDKHLAVSLQRFKILHHVCMANVSKKKSFSKNVLTSSYSLEPLEAPLPQWNHGSRSFYFLNVTHREMSTIINYNSMFDHHHSLMSFFVVVAKFHHFTL